MCWCVYRTRRSRQLRCVAVCCSVLQCVAGCVCNEGVFAMNTSNLLACVSRQTEKAVSSLGHAESTLVRICCRMFGSVVQCVAVRSVCELFDACYLHFAKNVLLWVAVCCSVLHVCCSVCELFEACHFAQNVLLWVAVGCSVLQCVAVCCKCVA